MTPAETLKHWLAVQPCAGRIAAALYAADGEIVGFDELRAVSGQTAWGLYRSIRSLRAAMDPRSVESVRAKGYRLTAVGIADCDRAMADAGQMARAA